MDTNSWLAALSSLAGALIGATAVLLSQTLSARRQARVDAAREHKLAVEEVLVKAQAVDLQAHEMVLLATNVGSMTGLMSRVLGAVSPIDFLAVFDRMNQEANGLRRAATQVWLLADERTVALSNSVVLAAMDVVDAHHQPAVGLFHNYTRIALTGRLAKNDRRIAETRSALASARRDLVNHTRAQLSLPEADPFSVVSNE